jgi:hypothetical protein
VSSTRHSFYDEFVRRSFAGFTHCDHVVSRIAKRHYDGKVKVLIGE